MGSITVFQFNNQDSTKEFRVVTIDGEPWWVADDVAKVLEYSDNSMMLKHVDTEDKQVINPHKLDSIEMTETFDSNTFRLSIVNESGLYAIIFGSHKPEAKMFKKWVTAEVLPSIRKTGKYEAKPKSLAELCLEHAQALVDQERRLQQLELEAQLARQEMQEMKEMTQQHDAELDRVFNPYGHYMSVLGYYKLHKNEALSIKTASSIGKKCTKYCKENNIPVEKINDPRFGQINSYPEQVIEMFV
jgi:prophage antirepressor-like protein